MRSAPAALTHPQSEARRAHRHPGAKSLGHGGVRLDVHVGRDAEELAAECVRQLRAAGGRLEGGAQQVQRHQAADLLRRTKKKFMKRCLQDFSKARFRWALELEQGFLLNQRGTLPPRGGPAGQHLFSIQHLPAGQSAQKNLEKEAKNGQKLHLGGVAIGFNLQILAGKKMPIQLAS